MRHRELAAASTRSPCGQALAAAYAGEHLGAAVAAAEGFIDEVIEPAQTRGRLIGALAALGAER